MKTINAGELRAMIPHLKDMLAMERGLVPLGAGRQIARITPVRPPAEASLRMRAVKTFRGSGLFPSR